MTAEMQHFQIRTNSMCYREYIFHRKWAVNCGAEKVDLNQHDFVTNYLVFDSLVIDIKGFLHISSFNSSA